MGQALTNCFNRNRHTEEETDIDWLSEWWISGMRANRQIMDLELETFTHSDYCITNLKDINRTSSDKSQIYSYAQDGNASEESYEDSIFSIELNTPPREMFPRISATAPDIDRTSSDISQIYSYAQDDNASEESYENSICSIELKTPSDEMFPRISATAPAITFTDLNHHDKEVVTFSVCTQEDVYPNLGVYSRVVSEVCHLLPHGRVFDGAITVQIRVEKALQFGLHGLTLFYSSTRDNEKPHWEIIPIHPNTYSQRRVLENTCEYILFSMPTFCLVCVAELLPSDLHQIENHASTFDVYVGILFEAEQMNNNESQKWLIKVRVLFSLTKFKWKHLSKIGKYCVAKDSMLGDVRVHVHDVKQQWILDDPEFAWEDITVFQLEHGKRDEVMFSYYSEDAHQKDTFVARVRLHQENARNDCELALKDNCMLEYMLTTTNERRANGTVNNGYTSSNNRSTNEEGVQTMTKFNIHSSNQIISMNGTNGTTANIPTFVPNGTTSNIPTFVQGVSSSSFRNLETTFDDLMADISAAVDLHPTDDQARVLKSLCERLKFKTNISKVLHSAENANISPALQVLKKWKNKTGGNLRVLRDVHSTYVSDNCEGNGCEIVNTRL